MCKIFHVHGLNAVPVNSISTDHKLQLEQAGTPNLCNEIVEIPFLWRLQMCAVENVKKSIVVESLNLTNLFYGLIRVGETFRI